MKKISFLLFTAILLYPLAAQTKLQSKTSDELFTAARELAFNGKRDSARVLLNEALRKSPDYSDIRIFLARTYAWDGQRENARKEIAYVLFQHPENSEALDAAIDIELWDDKPAKALELSVKGLRMNPNNEDFLLKKAKALKDLNRDDEALITLSILEDLNPSNPEVPKMRETIQSTFMQQSVSVNETYDHFSQRFDPAHLLYLQYSRSTVLGSFIGRINYGRRFQKNGVQYEVDAYPRIVNGIYAYLNYGYSSATFFPSHRAGLEAFFKLPASFEGSFGARYLNFGPGSDVTIYTGSAGYYYRDYWFSLRPYVTPGSVSFSRSLSFTTRYYYNGTADEYLSAKIGGGYSPDEKNYNDSLSSSVYFLKAQSAGIGWQKPIGSSSMVTANIDYTNQELSSSAGEYVKVYSFSLGYRYKF
jgi:YaiO family outer membrane protein